MDDKGAVSDRFTADISRGDEWKATKFGAGPHLSSPVHYVGLVAVAAAVVVIDCSNNTAT